MKKSQLIFLQNYSSKLLLVMYKLRFNLKKCHMYINTYIHIYLQLKAVYKCNIREFFTKNY